MKKYFILSTSIFSIFFSSLFCHANLLDIFNSEKNSMALHKKSDDWVDLEVGEQVEDINAGGSVDGEDNQALMPGATLINRAVLAVKASIPYVIIPATYFGFQYMFPGIDNEGNPNAFSLSGSGTSFFNFMGGSFLMAQIMQKPINALLASGSDYFPASWLSEDHVKIRALQADYDNNKDRLSKGLQSFIESTIGQAKFIVRWQEKISSDEHLNSAFEVSKLLVKLPQARKQIVYSTLENRLEEMIKDYPEEFQEKLRALLSQICITSTSKELEKNVFFFLGEPGTGKTRFAKFLSELTGLHLEVAKLSKKPEHVIGDSSPNSKDVLLEGLTKNKENHQNMIFFVDEVDKDMSKTNKYASQYQSFLLEVLEDEQKTYFSAKVNREISIPALNIILAGNAIPQIEGLGRRLEVIEFPAFGKDQKLSIARDYLSKRFDSYHQSTLLNDEDEEILEQLIKADESPGVGYLLKACKQYALFKTINAYARLPKRFDVEAALKAAKMTLSQKKNKRGKDESSSSDEEHISD